MTKRKQVSKRTRIKPARTPHVGIIYASDELADEGRARLDRMARIMRIVKTSLGSVARVTDGEAITDLLADLRHYCDCKDLAFSALNQKAIESYEDEVTGRDEWRSPFRDLKVAM
jgi:hypothetical protein